MTEKKQKRKPRSYTDEFKKQLVDLYHSGKRKCDICREYDISSSLKVIKTEFVRNQRFCDLYQLQIPLSDYVNWFNNYRIHSSLNYMTSVEYRENILEKVV